MSMMMTGTEAGGMDILEIRRILKERYRKANNLKSCSAETNKNSSLFGSESSSLAPRLIDDSDALMPEMIKILEKMDNTGPRIPAKATKPSSGVDLKSLRGKKLKESRDYSCLLSETSEVSKVSKPSPPKPIPKADGNGIPKTSRDKVTKSQAEFAKQILKPKQAELSNTKVMPRKEGASLKRKVMIKKRRMEEDLEDDENVDVSSIIQEIMGKRGKRRYKDYGAGGEDRAMVSGFNDILQEENRSARIARKEDAIEALRLEQEEKQERLSKAKKQKLMN